jgi:hypothetical protein
LKVSRLFFFRHGLVDSTIRAVLFVALVVSVLPREGEEFFAEVPTLEFLTATQETPILEIECFGITTLVSSTLYRPRFAPVGPAGRGEGPADGIRLSAVCGPARTLVHRMCVRATDGRAARCLHIPIVTHNMQQAARISDFTAFRHLGQMVEYDVTQEAFMQPKDDRTQACITGRFG